jgi:uncharacterized protein
MSKSIVTATLANVELDPSQIPQDWILEGAPSTRSKMLVRTNDWTSNIVVWECTPGSYRWHYNQDEAVFVLVGEGIMTNENGEERHFGPGDMGFFPAGTTCVWRHPSKFRKVAVLKESMWRPLGFLLKVWCKLLRTVGGSGGAPLMLVLAALMSSTQR